MRFSVFKDVRSNVGFDSIKLFMGQNESKL